MLVAAGGDALVEALQNAGVFGASPIDRNHQGVLPVLALAAIALVALGGAIARYRLSADGDWLVAMARDFERAAPRAHLLAIVGGALALVCGIEEYERGFGGGAPFAGAATTPLATIASLSIYAVCAALVARALGAFMRGVVATCDAVVRAVAAVVAWLDRSAGAAVSYRGFARSPIARHPASPHRALSRDRSPPHTA
ncbi:MAG: hypothetical protein NVS2B8_14000 [Vulcanimicrobiaceae bacterium]